jgi:6-phosphofructokinase 2
MENIVTITLNPSIDKSTSVPSLAPEKKLRCTPPEFEPGGGGINVSRAIKKIGGLSTAIFLSGGYSGKFLESLIKNEGIDSKVISISSHTRENMVVLSEADNLQYRFTMPGPYVQENEWRECLATLQRGDGYKYVVISGSNAPGVPVDFFSKAAEITKQKNARLIVDTSEQGLEHALNAGVYLAKPNLGELSSLSGVEELDAVTVVKAARSIIDKGKCEVMVVSMGASGAMLITTNEAYHQAAPAVKKKSTVGAGDSMLAGILIALSKGWHWKNVLQYGVACGTAATMNAGTGLCRKEDVEKIYSFFH